VPWLNDLPYNLIFEKRIKMWHYIDPYRAFSDNRLPEEEGFRFQVSGKGDVRD